MTASSGPSGRLAVRFEDGLRFLATALALGQDGRSSAAAVSAACDALRCFLVVLSAGAEAHVPDAEGKVHRLREQCTALLTPGQVAAEAALHAVEAACLARDAAARVLPLLPTRS